MQYGRPRRDRVHKCSPGLDSANAICFGYGFTTCTLLLNYLKRKLFSVPEQLYRSGMHLMWAY
jgi:hypothetical protein